VLASKEEYAKGDLVKRTDLSPDGQETAVQIFYWKGGKARTQAKEPVAPQVTK
jgi:hypothetical protein